MTATLALMLAIKENNQEFKERTLILIDDWWDKGWHHHKQSEI